MGLVHTDVRRRRRADADHSLRMARHTEGGRQQLPGRRPPHRRARVRGKVRLLPGQPGRRRERSVQRLAKLARLGAIPMGSEHARQLPLAALLLVLCVAVILPHPRLSLLLCSCRCLVDAIGRGWSMPPDSPVDSRPDVLFDLTDRISAPGNAVVLTTSVEPAPVRTARRLSMGCRPFSLLFVSPLQ